MKLRIATRQSKLALWQAHHVKNLLEALHPALTIELIGITTEGDQIQDRSLAEFGGKGLFVKALEEALINNKADIAVHSMKDVPPILPDDLMISAILPREDASDVLLSTRFNSLKELPKCAIVGTSSVRRTVQLLAIRPDLTIKLLRGNIDTRLKKLHDGQYDAIILAAAGLKRLDLENHITEYLSFEQCLPSVAQGAIGIELRANDQATKKIIAPLNDENTFICVTAERSLIQHLNGNCHSPIGAYAEIKNEILLLQGLLANSNGTKIVREKISGNIPDSEMLAISLAKKLKSLL